MPKYENKQTGTINIDSDGSEYVVTSSVDTLGYITLEVGHAMTLRLNHNNIEKLEQLLKECRYHLEDQAIDQAGEGSGIPMSSEEYMDDPRSW